MNFAYEGATGTFTMTGAASVDILGDYVDVDFGGDGTQGLVIQNGALVSMDMAVTSSIDIAGLTFGTQGLTLTYTDSTDQWVLTGEAGFEHRRHRRTLGRLGRDRGQRRKRLRAW